LVRHLRHFLAARVRITICGLIKGDHRLLFNVLVPALLYIVAGAAMHSFVPAVPIWGWVAGFIIVNTVVNYIGIEMTARVNRYMLVAECINGFGTSATATSLRGRWAEPLRRHSAPGSGRRRGYGALAAPRWNC